MPTLLAIPIVSAELPLAEQVRAALAAGADLVELRADCIGDADAVAALLAQPHAAPYILTVRAADEGGMWDGDDAERIALLERLGLLLPGYVDVEYATWQRSANVRQKIGLVCDLPEPPAQADAVRPKNRLILSHHDLHATPADIATTFAALAATPAAVVKAVFTARDATDALRVLVALRQSAAACPTIALAMGEAGLATRVLARKFGAFLSFAARERGGESAPGQPTARELRDVYRWDELGAATRVYGVVGWPVRQSRGPWIHNAALRADRIDGVYLPLPVGPTYAEFAAFMNCVAAHAELDVHGLSITIPHKEHALRWLDAHGGDVTPLARTCGAVNTLTRRGQRWEGHNTDVGGVLAALATVPGFAATELSGRNATILGAGGAARAAAVALVGAGCHVTICNRTPARARALAEALGCAHRPWAERGTPAPDVVVNCTKAGMAPAADESPLPAERLDPRTLVVDTVYNPPQTRLLRDARARGCRTVSGIEMFLAQAAEQCALWHGRPARPEVLRDHLDADRA